MTAAPMTPASTTPASTTPAPTMTVPMTAQLALPFPYAPRLRNTDLLPNAAQDEARVWLDRTPGWPLRRLALWGAAGSGKSHLLHAWAEGVGGTVVCGAPANGWPRGPVALDGLDGVRDELALLYLLNATAEARQPLLLASTRAPGRLPIRLPDLASRLRATTAVRIGPAPDAFLRLLLARLLAERQLAVPASTQAWLLNRLPRAPAALCAAVEKLDAAGLASGRAITRSLAAATLDLHDNRAVSPHNRAAPPPAASPATLAFG